jgi:hypothetical protein
MNKIKHKISLPCRQKSFVKTRRSSPLSVGLYSSSGEEVEPNFHPSSSGIEEWKDTIPKLE